jgi:hypothetical protein
MFVFIPGFPQHITMIPYPNDQSAQPYWTMIEVSEWYLVDSKMLRLILQPFHRESPQKKWFPSNLRLTMDQLLPIRRIPVCWKGSPCIQLWIPVTRISWRRWWQLVLSVNLISIFLSWVFHPAQLGWWHWNKWACVSMCSQQVGQSIVYLTSLYLWINMPIGSIWCNSFTRKGWESCDHPTAIAWLSKSFHRKPDLSFLSVPEFEAWWPLFTWYLGL